MRADQVIGITNYGDDYATPASRKDARKDWRPLEKRPTLLWVDDSSSLLELYKAVYEQLGFNVLTTSSPEEAFSYSELADVVILDYDMPDMNGAALASLLKSKNALKPIILHSGNSSIPPAASQWVDAICSKGAPREELHSTIERLCAEQPSSDQEIFSGAICPAIPAETQLEFLRVTYPDFPNLHKDKD